MGVSSASTNTAPKQDGPRMGQSKYSDTLVWMGPTQRNGIMMHT